ncbi:MAG: glutaminyl-peptide cyclotransferase [Caulobacteraceae bacterium]|nr:glutaminyl-peptide cyclotransferase [Caulobacter sp.]
MTGGCARAQDDARPPVYGFHVVRVFPHDRGAFTEGLVYHDGQLYESTGMNGRSSIRRVDLDTGKVLQQRDIDRQFFGEGIVPFGDKLYELTWRSGVGFIYDLKTFQPLGRFSYPGEGWALTTDGRRLIMSDGTSVLRFLDPATLKETGRLAVTYRGKPLAQVNELEWVKGEILANLWMTDQIVRIDPKSGRVTGVIDLQGLLPQSDRRGDEDVLNGIAYDKAGDRLFVTGKQWPHLYQIEIVPPPPGAR